MRKAIHSTVPVAPVVYRQPSKRRHAKMMFDMFPPKPPIERTEKLNGEYIRYISDGLADTDGYYLPLDFQAWAATR